MSILEILDRHVFFFWPLWVQIRMKSICWLIATQWRIRADRSMHHLSNSFCNLLWTLSFLDSNNPLAWARGCRKLRTSAYAVFFQYSTSSTSTCKDSTLSVWSAINLYNGWSIKAPFYCSLSLNELMREFPPTDATVHVYKYHAECMNKS